jgi:predicted aspartyl protease
MGGKILSSMSLKKIIAFLSICFISAAAFAGEFPANKKLKALLDSGEYFQFRNELEKDIVNNAGENKSWSADPENLYFLAWDNFLFNESKASNKNIDALLSVKNFTPPDSITAELLQLHFQNDFRLFNYKTADSVCTVLINNYSSVIAPSVLTGIKNSAEIAKGLVNVPAQTMTRKGDTTLFYKRDVAGLIRIPVTMNGETENFIFDTGANFSTISESQAKIMGVKILDTKFAVTSSSKSSVDSKLGMADELHVGNMTFRNVVFIVLPDKALKFAGGIYKIKGIIGLPVIAQMQHIEITKDKVKIGSGDKDLHPSNLGLEGNTPFVTVSFYGDAKSYVFDTGAAASVFGTKFNTTYRDSIGSAKETSQHVGGAGGVQKVSTRLAKNVHYEFAGKKGTLKRIAIQMNGVADVLGNHYGIVGEDIFTQWETMVIDFDQMYVELK